MKARFRKRHAARLRRLAYRFWKRVNDGHHAATTRGPRAPFRMFKPGSGLAESERERMTWIAHCFDGFPWRPKGDRQMQPFL
jgi:hypothetical protein